MSFVQDNNMVKALPTDGADHTFDISVLPGRRRRRYDILNSKRANPSLNSESIFRVAVSNQILRRRLEWKRFGELLRYPFRSWVCCNIEMDYPSSCVFDDDKNIQNVESRGWNGKEIDSRDCFLMIRKNVIQKKRSIMLGRARFTERFNMMICCRSARFSRASSRRDFIDE